MEGDDKGKLRIEGHRGGVGRLRRFTMTVLFVAGIVLATVFFAVRTDGGRDFIRHQLGLRLGMNVSIGYARIGLPYDLVLGEVVSEGYEPGRAGFLCKEVRLGVGMRTLFRLKLTGPVLNMEGGAEGQWAPARFGRMGELPWKSVAEIGRLTERLRARWRVDVEDGEVSWTDAGGTVSAQGVAFRMMPVDIPGRRYHYYYLAVRGAQAGEGVRARQMEREWLASESVAYIGLASGGTVEEGCAWAFWEVENDR